MPIHRLACALIGMLILPAAVNAEPDVKTWQKSFTVAAHPTLRVTTHDARVHLRTGPAGTVAAVVRYEAHRWGWVTGGQVPEVVFGQQGNLVTVEVKQRGEMLVVGGVSQRFDVDVTIPADCDLEVRTGDGSVTVEQPVTGRVNIETGDGHVTVRGGKGDFRLRSGDGGIDADGLDGSLSAHSADGRVHVAGRFDHLDIRAADGRVDATVATGSQLADEWRVESQDGSITLRIPRALKAELDARTQDGAIHFRLPVPLDRNLDSHRVRGLINGGGPLLYLRSGDGSMTLEVSD